MATWNLGLLGNGIGYIYERKSSGSIDTHTNTNENLMQLMLQANKSRIIYSKYTAETSSYTERFSDPEYGSEFFYNNSASAPIGSIVGADEITDYLIVPTKNNVVQAPITAGEIEYIRLSPQSILGISPESGLLDNLDILTSDAQKGDIVYLTLSEDDASAIITIRDESVSSGNIKLFNNTEVIVSGNAVVMLVKGADYWIEVSRPNDNILSVAKKTLTVGGGSYHVLDTTTPAGQRVTSKRGLVILEGAITLLSSWLVDGETSPTSLSEGITIDVVPGASLITTDAIALTVFGIVINPIYTKASNWWVRAWWNSVDNEWVATLSVSELTEGYVDMETVATRNETNTSAGDVEICRTISHTQETYGLISFLGDVTMAVTLASGAGAKLLYNALDDTMHPSRHVKHLCSVERGGIPTLVCLVEVRESTITVLALPNYSLQIGDIIDFSSIKYIAEPTFSS